MSIVFVYGVPESASSSISIGITEDKAAITDILAVIKNSIPAGIKLARLKRANANTIQPLKILFNSKSEALDILAAFGEASRSGVVFLDGFRTARDKISLQRQMLRQRYLEIEKKRHNGENDLKIKLDNYLPKVVTGNIKKLDPRHLSKS